MPDPDLQQLASAAEAIALAQDRVDAARIYDALRPHDGALIAVPHSPAPGGCVAYYLAILSRVAGRLADAGRHLESALAHHVRRNELPWVVRIRLEYARLLLARGDDASRREALTHIEAAERSLTQRDTPLADELAGLRQRATRGSRNESANLIRRSGDVWTIRYDGLTCHLPEMRGLGLLAALLEHAGRDVSPEELEATAAGAPRVACSGTTGAERSRVRVTRAIRTAIERIAAAHPALGRHLTRSVRTGHACAYRPESPSPTSWET